ncbi:unnamed protein product [Closterium sp. Naga37s-1]|nr:unnamed protein product [Closterium sp. Naga37s-1]
MLPPTATLSTTGSGLFTSSAAQLAHSSLGEGPSAAAQNHLLRALVPPAPGALLTSMGWSSSAHSPLSPTPAPVPTAATDPAAAPMPGPILRPRHGWSSSLYSTGTQARASLGISASSAAAAAAPGEAYAAGSAEPRWGAGSLIVPVGPSWAAAEAAGVADAAGAAEAADAAGVAGVVRAAAAAEALGEDDASSGELAPEWGMSRTKGGSRVMSGRSWRGAWGGRSGWSGKVGAKSARRELPDLNDPAEETDADRGVAEGGVGERGVGERGAGDRGPRRSWVVERGVGEGGLDLNAPAFVGERARSQLDVDSRAWGTDSQAYARGGSDPLSASLFPQVRSRSWAAFPTAAGTAHPAAAAVGAVSAAAATAAATAAAASSAASTAAAAAASAADGARFDSRKRSKTWGGRGYDSFLPSPHTPPYSLNVFDPLAENLASAAADVALPAQQGTSVSTECNPEHGMGRRWNFPMPVSGDELAAQIAALAAADANADAAAGISAGIAAGFSMTRMRSVGSLLDKLPEQHEYPQPGDVSPLAQKVAELLGDRPFYVSGPDDDRGA